VCSTSAASNTVRMCTADDRCHDSTSYLRQSFRHSDAKRASRDEGMPVNTVPVSTFLHDREQHMTDGARCALRCESGQHALAVPVRGGLFLRGLTRQRNPKRRVSKPGNH
jgi:hypothetical protein